MSYVCLVRNFIGQCSKLLINIFVKIIGNIVLLNFINLVQLEDFENIVSNCSRQIVREGRMTFNYIAHSSKQRKKGKESETNMNSRVKHISQLSSYKLFSVF